MAGKKRRIRVANELPKTRRLAIKKALEEHESEARPEWDRSSEWGDARFLRKRIKIGEMRTIHMPLLDVDMGDSWPIPITVFHGVRPGPVVTIIGASHGDELTGTSACTNLLSSIFTEPEGALDPQSMAGTVRIVPVLNLPGYRAKTRYFPDGRDLNRAFPGLSKGSTTSRVASRVKKNLINDSDVIIDLHSAATGRSNMPQIRGDLSHPESYLLAKAFGIEVVLDSRPPKGSLRRVANEMDIAAVTYEGGGANRLDQNAVKVAVHGCLNVLRALKVIPKNPSRPRFRLNAGGSTWLRAGEGGLLDMFVGPGSIVTKGDVIATISDPGSPGLSVDIVAPENGLMICTATNPFVTAGTPVGHFLPVTKHIELLKTQMDDRGVLMVNGSQGEALWRDEVDIVEEIKVEGEWSGGSVDGEWNQINAEDTEQEEAA
ncbi:MAG: succinylglutamate desuccinylase/aspartoacylase family protein [Candidatus Poseidoniaceae archaeon]